MVDFALCVELIVIICTKVRKWDVVFEYVVNRYEHCVSDSNRSTVCSPSDDKPMVLCREEGISFLDCGFGALDQCCFYNVINSIKH